MADTKITALTALTGANVATGDQMPIVDVSDTTMAGSGTDKNITANELAIAMSILATYFAPIGLTGATGVVASRYVGSSVGAPTTGTFVAGDWVISRLSSVVSIYGCTAGGTPGTWNQITALAQNRLNVDTLWAAVGDLVVGNGSAASVILPVSTVAGRAVTADPNATSKLSWSDPLSVSEAQSGVSALTSTYNRIWAPGSVTAFTPTSGTLYLFLIPLPKGITVTTLTVYAGTTAGASLTHSWMAISNNSRVQKAISADTTTATWTASTSRSYTMTTPYVTTAATTHYVWLCIVGTTIPTIEAVTALPTSGARNTSPKAGGATSDTGLTTPASGPSTAGTIATVGPAVAYIEVA